MSIDYITKAIEWGRNTRQYFSAVSPKDTKISRQKTFGEQNIKYIERTLKIDIWYHVMKGIK